ncbi:MAG: FAD-dependent oxidoreductase, partial [Spirochaeta sp.]|nr:FAD-dependent oxidoreductase [Spirochaeta sp.]
IIQAELAAAGVHLHLGAAVKSVGPAEGRSAGGGADGAAGASDDASTLPAAATVTYTSNGDASAAPAHVSGDQLLVAIGRAPNIQGIGLEEAGVRFHPRGVEVNAFLQTSNRRIYAAGDVASPYQFTHMAEAAAGIVVQNALFARTARFDRLIVPWSTYTSPEVAHVGLSESGAARDTVPVDVYRHEMSAVDRAKLDGETEGFVKILTRRGTTKIVGCTIVAAHAGEMIAEVVLAMQNGIGIDKLAGVIHPYPTQAEAVKRAAAGYLRNKLTPRARSLMGWWFRMRR